MYLALKESIPHGTKDYPYDQCFIHNIHHAFQFPVHWHDELEVIYIKKGFLDITINEQLYHASAGSVFFVNPRELHLMGSEDLGVAYYTLLFPLEFISFQSNDLLETSLLHPLRSGTLQFSHELIDKSHNAALAAILDKIIDINQTCGLSSQIKTRLLLLELLAALLNEPCFFKEGTHGKPTDFQRELLAFVREHYTEPLSLAVLADRFHLSEKYISRYFNEHFHISFIQYLNHQRLMHSKKLLETTEMPVTEVAMCSGFANVSYFIRIFKKAYGISPLKYRRATVAD